MITFDKVSKRYASGQDALAELSFEIAAGEMVFVELEQATPKPKTFEISLILRGDKKNEGVIWCPWK